MLAYLPHTRTTYDLTLLLWRSARIVFSRQMQWMGFHDIASIPQYSYNRSKSFIVDIFYDSDVA